MWIYYIKSIDKGNYNEVLYYEKFNLDTIETPVKVEELDRLLKLSKYDQEKSNYLVQGFKHGFDIGYRGEENVQLTSPNLKFVVGNNIELWNKVMAEVKAKRYTGPFSSIPFKNYIQSPIGLVPKDNGKKTRLIFHLSFPKDGTTSLNYNTPKELTSVKYDDLDFALKLVVAEGIIDVYLGKSDMSHAFRNLPIFKKFWKYLVMKAQSPLDGKIYYFIDKCLPFGAAISCAIFQAFSDAISHLVEFYSGKPNTNYLDDFLFVAWLLENCSYQLRVFLDICQEINFPVALEKTVWPTKQIEFLGMLINTQRGIICIPNNKLEKARFAVKKMLSKKRTTLREVQQLTGLLNFLGKAIIPGRAFMRRLYAVGSHLSKPHLHLPIKEETRLDLKVWEEMLNYPDIYYRKIFEFDNSYLFSPLDFYTDALSTIGCGGYYKTHWFYHEWSEETLKLNPSINYLELYALTAAILLWGEEQEIKNRRVIVFCDNQSVIYMVNNNTSSCRNCMVLIRILVLFMIRNNIKIKVKYVKSAENCFADMLSRSQIVKFSRLAKKLNRTFDKYPTELPNVLVPIQKLWLPENK